MMDDAIEFMRDLDRRFRERSGLADRRYYSIFYSRLQPARVMVIGINPGGRTDGTHQLASQTFYEDWSHEYVDEHYRIATVMRGSLMQALGAETAEELRGVPKTNSFFQRAVGTSHLTAGEIGRHVELCAPFVREMLEYVAPDALVLEGSAARDMVVQHQCASVVEFPEDEVWGDRRGRRNRFFRRERATLLATGKDVDLLTLGHPSHFGHLPPWRAAVDALRSRLGRGYLPPVPKEAKRFNGGDAQ